jgi:hypothetical protein
VRTVRIALGAAVAWSVALVVAALTVPVYSGDSITTESSGVSTSTTTATTLVAENGWWGLVVAGIPLACSVVVAVLLLGVRRRPAEIAALVIVGLLGVGTVLALLSVGLFVAPVTAALGLAVLVSLSTTPHVRTVP